jgi:hypothetical protein
MFAPNPISKLAGFESDAADGTPLFDPPAMFSANPVLHFGQVWHLQLLALKSQFAAASW